MAVTGGTNRLTLLFLTTDGNNEKTECDSVHLLLRDGVLGNEGGSIGIRKGHVKSVLALQSGLVTAYSDGNVIFSKKAENALAYIENDVVTVLSD